MPKRKTRKCSKCGKRFSIVKPLDFHCAICQVKMDQGAIEATLEKCGGHLSLASMIAFYQTYEKFWKKYRVLIQAIQQADEGILVDERHHMPLRDYQIAALNRVVKEVKGRPHE